MQSLALDVKVLTENNDELIIREFEDEEPNVEPKRDDFRTEEEDFDFGMDEGDDEDEDEGIGSIFDEAGDDEDFVSDDLFGDKDLAEEDDMSDVDEDFSFGSLFDDDENPEDGEDN